MSSRPNKESPMIGQSHGVDADFRSAEGMCIHQAIGELGLTITVLRRWEDARVIVFERRRGRRIVDDAAFERLRILAELRRARFTIREIAWISNTLPPSIPAMRQALQARLDTLEQARTRTIVQVKALGRTLRFAS
jgi:DNA-binding transcriptional MerR regulator